MAICRKRILRTWIGGHDQNYKRLYEELFDEGKLRVEPGESKALFQEDVSFKSPSAAAAIVLGRAANGRTEWKVKGTNKTYADWQNEQIEKVDAI